MKRKLKSVENGSVTKFEQLERTFHYDNEHVKTSNYTYWRHVYELYRLKSHRLKQERNLPSNSRHSFFCCCSFCDFLFLFFLLSFKKNIIGKSIYRGSKTMFPLDRRVKKKMLKKKKALNYPSFLHSIKTLELIP